MFRTFLTTLWPLWILEVFGNQLAVLAETLSYAAFNLSKHVKTFLALRKLCFSSKRTSGQLKRFWSVLAWFLLQKVFKSTFITTRITAATTPGKCMDSGWRRRCGWAHCYWLLQCYRSDLWILEYDEILDGQIIAGCPKKVPDSSTSPKWPKLTKSSLSCQTSKNSSRNLDYLERPWQEQQGKRYTRILGIVI